MAKAICSSERSPVTAMPRSHIRLQGHRYALALAPIECANARYVRLCILPFADCWGTAGNLPRDIAMNHKPIRNGAIQVAIAAFSTSEAWALR